MHRNLLRACLKTPACIALVETLRLSDSVQPGRTTSTRYNFHKHI